MRERPSKPAVTSVPSAARGAGRRQRWRASYPVGAEQAVLLSLGAQAGNRAVVGLVQRWASESERGTAASGDLARQPTPVAPGMGVPVQRDLFVGKEAIARITLDDPRLKEVTLAERQKIGSYIESPDQNYVFTTWERLVEHARGELKSEQITAEPGGPASSAPSPPPPAPPPPAGPPPPATAQAPGAGPALPPLSEKDMQTYGDCVAKGRERMEAILKGNGKPLSEEGKRTNEALFRLYKTQKSKEHEGHLESALFGNRGGTYTNLVGQGTMTAEANAHATRSGEAPSPLLPNSEILYHQYRTGPGGPLTSLKRSHVASENGQAVINVVLARRGQAPFEVGVGDEMFLAFLGTVNGTAAFRLAVDRGKELGIRGIRGARVNPRERVVEFLFENEK